MILAVAGKPIAHSASPDLHEAGFNCNELEGASFRIIADDASEVFKVCSGIGVTGCNVTAPFKSAVARLVDELSPEALVLDAVNTVQFKNKSTAGFNTDIFGVQKSLEILLQAKVPQKTAVLGAGGAAKAVCYVLKELGYEFCIINRSIDKAEALAREFSAKAYSFQDCEKRIAEAELLINCLSTTESPFDLNLLRAEQYLLDAHYKTKSDLAAHMESLGARVMDGRNWLLLQGLKSQQIFFGSQAPQLNDLNSALHNSRKLNELHSVVLVGLMGSGKSQSGVILAKKLGLKFVDLDIEIENLAGLKISEIFEVQGEDRFRDLESEVLEKILLKPEAQLISCGGGVILRSQNRTNLRDKCKVVWLWASLDTLVTRLDGATDRPLVAQGSVPLSRAELRAKLATLLEIRTMQYAKAADLVIGTGSRNAEQVAQRISDEISQ